jgi:TatD DNase family protein
MDWVDTHSHLPDADFDADRDAVFARAAEAGVARHLVVGTWPADWPVYLALAEKTPGVRVALGFHPNRARAFSEAARCDLKAHLAQRRGLAAAVGEIGLDFYRDHATPDEQRPVFQAQLALAAELDLPFILHCRAAERELLEVLAKHQAQTGRPLKGVWHSFSAGPEEARQAVALGLHLAFNGVVAYPKAEGVRQAAREAPPDRLLLETDAPYLPPQPWRGKRNEPAYLVATARRVAELRGVPLEQLAQQTTANAQGLFGAW